MRFNLSILQINTYGISGGAGKAAYRLHKGLLSAGQRSQYLVKEIKATVPEVITAQADVNFENKLKNDHLINKYYIWFNRTELSNTYFSFSYPGFDLSVSKPIRDADIVNLHWTEDFLSPVSLNYLFAQNKPVVWTLHDQKPFTGGCHYSAGCKNYQDLCRNCPQLQDDPFGLPTAVLKDKIELFKGADLTVVTPSLWLANEARESSLFKSNRIEVIPNAIEADIYYPVEKKAAKNRIGIDTDTITIMFGTADAREKRKGLKNLISALSYCIKDKEFKKLADAKKVVIICVGKTDTSIKGLPIPLLDMGYIENDGDMSRIYNASDMFVLPSLEDNLPNTMIEAMACGTPVISFDVGGIPDVITNDVNGKLVALKDDIGFGRAILELAFNSAIRRTMSEQCSSFIRNKFRLEDQAQNYIKLYDDLLKSRPSRTSTVVKHEGAYGTSVKTVYEDVLRFAKQKRNKMGLDR
jgi:glycosyltransferase involved in cell wall biosynthesis